MGRGAQPRARWEGGSGGVPGLSQAVGFGLETTASGEPDQTGRTPGQSTTAGLLQEGLTAERGRSMGGPKGGVLKSGRAETARGVSMCKGPEAEGAQRDRGAASGARAP